MLVPEGTLDEIVDFMDEVRGVGDDDGHSKERLIMVLDGPERLHFYEGYLSYHPSGEMRYRANTIAYSRSIHLYAWDKMVAFMPSNKRGKKYWLHEDLEEKLKLSKFPIRYGESYYATRIRECLENSQRI